MREEIDEGMRAAAVYEIRAGALQDRPAVAIIEQLKQTTAVIAVIDNQHRRRRLLGKWEIHAAEPAPPPSHVLGRPSQDAMGQNPDAATTSY